MHQFKLYFSIMLLSLSLQAGRADLQVGGALDIYRFLLTIHSTAETIGMVMSWWQEPEVLLEEEEVETDPAIVAVREALLQAILNAEEDDILDFLHNAELETAPLDYSLHLIAESLNQGIPEYAESIIMAGAIHYDSIPAELFEKIKAYRRSLVLVPFVQSESLLDLPTNPTVFGVDAAFHAILNRRSIKQVVAHFESQPFLVEGYLAMVENLRGLRASGTALIQPDGTGIDLFVEQYNQFVSNFNELAETAKSIDFTSMKEAEQKEEDADSEEEDAYEVVTSDSAELDNLDEYESENLAGFILHLQQHGFYGSLDALPVPREGAAMNISGQGINYNIGGKIVAAKLYHLKLSKGMRVFFTEDPYGVIHIVLTDNHTPQQARNKFKSFLKTWNQADK